MELLFSLLVLTAPCTADTHNWEYILGHLAGALRSPRSLGAGGGLFCNTPRPKKGTQALIRWSCIMLGTFLSCKQPPLPHHSVQQIPPALRIYRAVRLKAVSEEVCETVIVSRVRSKKYQQRNHFTCPVNLRPFLFHSIQRKCPKCVCLWEQHSTA